jgi:hypothetical protein
MQTQVFRSTPFRAISIALLVTLGATMPASTQTRGGGNAQQEQQVLPPEARYWVGATTVGGLTAMGGGMAQGRRPSMAEMMRMGANGIPTEARSVELRLGSTLGPKGSPEAYHTMPPGAQVNKPIFLETPEAAGQTGSTEPYRQPKGQITFYWGCGERAGPGQPVVLTFDKLLRGQNDPELQALAGAVSARGVSKPTPATSKTYGQWPHGDRGNKNRDLRASFAVGSTLAGPHAIEGTYSPRIEFTLAADKTFMDAVRYTSSAVQSSGALALNWGAVRRATGYSIGVMAPERVNDDSANIVMWSSADRPATFIQMEDLTPAEVDRLIGLKAVLPPTTTTCTVPAEVVKATKDGSMLMFTAFGDEATFIYPARPADLATPWDQEWFSRVSFKSTRMDLITAKGVQDLSGMAGAGPGTAAAPPESQSDEEYCRALEADRQKRSGGGIAGRLPGRLGRLGGRNRQEEEPVDPRCVKK